MQTDYSNKTLRVLPMALVALLLAFQVTTAVAQSEQEATAQENKDTETKRTEMVAKAVEYLKTTGADTDGTYSKQMGPAVTALVTTALLKNDIAVDDETIQKSLTFLKGFVQPDGGIYSPESPYKNYETSLTLMCFAEAKKASKSSDYDMLIEKAASFLKGSQWGAENRPIDESDSKFGGFGYGKHGRPDLSNTSYTIDALMSAGEDADSEAIQRALKFVSRTQNHESPHNTTPNTATDYDGGFKYTPMESKVKASEEGALRSYGSMTYAGLKSMLYAGVDKDDTRVVAATKWIRTHYGLESNPGMGAEGLYYYYHVFAKALDTVGEDTFVDDIDVTHDWRAELIDELYKRQAEDGSWVNGEADRWMEGDPNLVTGYALLALSYCKEKK